MATTMTCTCGRTQQAWPAHPPHTAPLSAYSLYAPDVVVPYPFSQQQTAIQNADYYNLDPRERCTDINTMSRMDSTLSAADTYGVDLDISSFPESVFDHSSPESAEYDFSDSSTPVDLNQFFLDPFGQSPDTSRTRTREAPQHRRRNTTSAKPPNASPPSTSKRDDEDRPICWDHGCDGKSFSSWSNLRRHQRERNGEVQNCYCPRCGAYFSRTTARNQHLANRSCNRIRRYSNGRIRASTLKLRNSLRSKYDSDLEAVQAMLYPSSAGI